MIQRDDDDNCGSNSLKINNYNVQQSQQHYQIAGQTDWLEGQLPEKLQNMNMHLHHHHQAEFIINGYQGEDNQEDRQITSEDYSPNEKLPCIGRRGDDHCRDKNDNHNIIAQNNLISSCRFCKTNLLEFVQSHLHDLHFERFNFYFAKGINEILANLTISHVILFKDYLFLDDDSEYLKRSYTYVEYIPRFKLLSDFYANQYKPTRPNLCIVSTASVVQKRNYKLAKLFMAHQERVYQMQEQQEAGENDQNCNDNSNIQENQDHYEHNGQGQQQQELIDNEDDDEEGNNDNDQDYEEERNEEDDDESQQRIWGNYGDHLLEDLNLVTNNNNQEEEKELEQEQDNDIVDESNNSNNRYDFEGSNDQKEGNIKKRNYSFLEELQRQEENDRISFETESHDIFKPVFSSELNSEQRNSHSNSSDANSNELPKEISSADSLFLLNAQFIDRDEQLKYGIDMCLQPSLNQLNDIEYLLPANLKSYIASEVSLSAASGEVRQSRIDNNNILINQTNKNQGTHKKDTENIIAARGSQMTIKPQIKVSQQQQQQQQYFQQDQDHWLSLQQQILLATQKEVLRQQQELNGPFSARTHIEMQAQQQQQEVSASYSNTNNYMNSYANKQLQVHPNSQSISSPSSSSHKYPALSPISAQKPTNITTSTTSHHNMQFSQNQNSLTQSANPATLLMNSAAKYSPQYQHPHMSNNTQNTPADIAKQRAQQMPITGTQLFNNANSNQLQVQSTQQQQQQPKSGSLMQRLPVNVQKQLTLNLQAAAELQQQQQQQVVNGKLQMMSPRQSSPDRVWTDRDVNPRQSLHPQKQKTNTGATSAISTLKNPSKASTLVLRKGELQQINKNATKYLSKAQNPNWKLSSNNTINNTNYNSSNNNNNFMAGSLSERTHLNQIEEEHLDLFIPPRRESQHNSQKQQQSGITSEQHKELSQKIIQSSLKSFGTAQDVYKKYQLMLEDHQQQQLQQQHYSARNNQVTQYPQYQSSQYASNSNNTNGLLLKPSYQHTSTSNHHMNNMNQANFNGSCSQRSEFDTATDGSSSLLQAGRDHKSKISDKQSNHKLLINNNNKDTNHNNISNASAVCQQQQQQYNNSINSNVSTKHAIMNQPGVYGSINTSNSSKQGNNTINSFNLLRCINSAQKQGSTSSKQLGSNNSGNSNSQNNLSERGQLQQQYSCYQSMEINHQQQQPISSPSSSALNKIHYGKQDQNNKQGGVSHRSTNKQINKNKEGQLNKVINAAAVGGGGVVQLDSQITKSQNLTALSAAISHQHQQQMQHGKKQLNNNLIKNFKGQEIFQQSRSGVVSDLTNRIKAQQNSYPDKQNQQQQQQLANKQQLEEYQAKIQQQSSGSNINKYESLITGSSSSISNNHNNIKSTTNNSNNKLEKPIGQVIIIPQSSNASKASPINQLSSNSSSGVTNSAAKVFFRSANNNNNNNAGNTNPKNVTTLTSSSNSNSIPTASNLHLLNQFMNPSNQSPLLLDNEHEKGSCIDSHTGSIDKSNSGSHPAAPTAFNAYQKEQLSDNNYHPHSNNTGQSSSVGAGLTAATIGGGSCHTNNLYNINIQSMNLNTITGPVHSLQAIAATTAAFNLHQSNTNQNSQYNNGNIYNNSVNHNNTTTHNSKNISSKSSNNQSGGFQLRGDKSSGMNKPLEQQQQQTTTHKKQQKSESISKQKYITHSSNSNNNTNNNNHHHSANKNPIAIHQHHNQQQQQLCYSSAQNLLSQEQQYIHQQNQVPNSGQQTSSTSLLSQMQCKQDPKFIINSIEEQHKQQHLGQQPTETPPLLYQQQFLQLQQQQLQQQQQQIINQQQQFKQLSNDEINEDNSYGFWTSRSNKQTNNNSKEPQQQQQFQQSTQPQQYSNSVKSSFNSNSDITSKIITKVSPASSMNLNKQSRLLQKRNQDQQAQQQYQATSARGSNPNTQLISTHNSNISKQGNNNTNSITHSTTKYDNPIILKQSPTTRKSSNPINQQYPALSARNEEQISKSQKSLGNHPIQQQQHTNEGRNQLQKQQQIYYDGMVIQKKMISPSSGGIPSSSSSNNSNNEHSFKPRNPNQK